MRSRSVVLLLVSVILGGCGDGAAEEAGSPTAMRSAPAVYGKESTGTADGTDGPGLVSPSLVPANMKEACDIVGPLIPGVAVTPGAVAWFDFMRQLDQLIRLSDDETAGVLAPLKPIAVVYFERAGHGGPSPSVQARWRSELETVSSRCREAGSSAVQAQS